MVITIVDNTFTRFSKLKYLLEDSCEDVVRTFYEVDDVTADYELELLLVHKGNNNIETLVQNVTPKCFILLFSGGGIAKDIEGIVYSDNMFNLSDVFNEGNEEQPIKKIKQIIDIVKNKFSSTNTITEIKKVLGDNDDDEKFTNDVFNAIYEQSNKERNSKKDK